MTTILACGNDPDIENELMQYFLKKPATIIHHKIFYSGKEELSLCFLQSLPKEIYLKNSILLFYSPFMCQKHTLNMQNSVVLSESSNKTALHLLMESNVQVVTYGLQSTDSITASSFGKERTLIALQREILGLKGEKIDPYEFSIANEKLSKPTQLIVGALEVFLQ